VRLIPGCCTCAAYNAKPLALSNTASAKIRVVFMWISVGLSNMRE
jgi:hypothetical protein